MASTSSGPALLMRSLTAVVPEVDAQAAAALAPHFHATEPGRGAALLNQGERWRQALLIERGLIRMYFVRRDGREFNKSFFAEGALVCPITPAMWAEPSLVRHRLHRGHARLALRRSAVSRRTAGPRRLAAAAA